MLEIVKVPLGKMENSSKCWWEALLSLQLHTGLVHMNPQAVSEVDTTPVY